MDLIDYFLRSQDEGLGESLYKPGIINWIFQISRFLEAKIIGYL